MRAPLKAKLLAAVSAILLALPCDVGWAQRANPASPVPATLPAADYFAKAAASWQAGARDDATFWLYVAQLRFRARLAAEPGLDPSGEPAVYAALMETVGRPINEYAFGDIPGACRQIDRALRWEADNPDPAIPEGIRQSTRAGLMALRDNMLESADDIRRQRAANGLPNR